MGMFRDSGDQEIDIVKEMAESLGSSGVRLDEILEKTTHARETAVQMLACYQGTPANCDKPDLAAVNDTIREYNALVEKAEDALKWLLIQREACGFRRHRDVHIHYPIPPKMRPLKK